jgi:hypothetical protein
MMSPSVEPRVDTWSSTPLLATAGAAVAAGAVAFAAVVPDAAVAWGVVEVAGCEAEGAA